MKRTVILLVSFLFVAQTAFAQFSGNTGADILRAEDERQFDRVISDHFKSKDPELRNRAVLAAGRIGDDAAVPGLISLLDDDSGSVASMAAFALGEIESINASDALLDILRRSNSTSTLRARAVEAAGKIAAANAKEQNAKALGEAILDTLEAEDRKGERQSKEVILLGLTAALRAKPDDADYVIEKFFTNKDGRIRADALNAYARLRGKGAVKKLISVLMIDKDPVARANACRALGVAADKTALNSLFNAAETDDDLRVRVSALRSVGSLKEPATADRLLKRLGAIFEQYKKSQYSHPVEQNELLEAASALGSVAEGSKSAQTLELLKTVSKALRFEAPEVEAAIAEVDPAGYWEYLNDTVVSDSRNTPRGMISSVAAISSIADFLNRDENAPLKSKITDHFRKAMPRQESAPKEVLLVIPPFVQMLADLKPSDTDDILRGYLRHKDVFIRAAAASAISDRPVTPENVEALVKAFGESLEADKYYDDAQLAILSAVVKLDKIKAKTSLEAAFKHYDYLVRREAFRLVKANDLEKEFPDAKTLVGGVRQYSQKTGSKLGQVLDTEEDYNRALSRKNGKTSAVVTTEKGKFTIDFFPEDAPLTVDNFIELANKGYFNGVDIHRVVANFVVQDGDPRGDGNGGPGWQIRCEINQIRYERGMVGMALSGKDTGGSQWFVTHSPQPHLDGGYTVFGKVGDEGMKTVDRLVRGDKIVKIEIVESR
jgi:cyclophilin family peptidyl-prolyl cis-trans isomerase/HEAT repeat protein